METKITPEQIALLEEVAGLLSDSTNISCSHAVYISPAEQLRRQADAIERRDSTIRRFRRELQFLKTSEYPSESINIIWNSGLCNTGIVTGTNLSITNGN